MASRMRALMAVLVIAVVVLAGSLAYALQASGAKPEQPQPSGQPAALAPNCDCKSASNVPGGLTVLGCSCGVVTCMVATRSTANLELNVSCTR